MLELITLVKLGIVPPARLPHLPEDLQPTLAQAAERTGVTLTFANSGCGRSRCATDYGPSIACLIANHPAWLELSQQGQDQAIVESVTVPTDMGALSPRMSNSTATNDGSRSPFSAQLERISLHFK